MHLYLTILYKTVNNGQAGGVKCQTHPPKKRKDVSTLAGQAGRLSCRYPADFSTLQTAIVDYPDIPRDDLSEWLWGIANL